MKANGSAIWLAAVLFALPAAAAAQSKIRVGYTATVDMVPMFAAIERSKFAERQIRVTPRLAAVNSLLPAALISNTVQLGTTTTATFLQALGGGLDLVSISRLNFTRKDEKNFEVVARAGSGVQKAHDLDGKTADVPGVNAVLHVLFVDWAKRSGFDPCQVSFVETPFPEMNEILKSGNVDAALAAELFRGRIIQSGAAVVIARFVQDERLPVVAFAGARQIGRTTPRLPTHSGTQLLEA